MAEMLHCCDENMDQIESYDRDFVHMNGIWHKTSHVWLYDDEGYVYFQVRADADKLYTSASGHVMSIETPTQAAVREMGEELGIKIFENELELIEVDAWKLDNEVKHDHVFAYIYLYKMEKWCKTFCINPTEVSGIVKVKASDLLAELLGVPVNSEQFDVFGKKLKKNKELLLMDGEVAILKYGRILKAIVNKGGK